MTIRFATAQDIPDLLDLLKEVLMIHHQGRSDLFKNAEGKYTAEELRDILSDPKRPVFVAEENSRVCGYAFCIHEQIENSHIRTAVKTLYIDDLCVRSDDRRKGIGKALYEHVLQYAKENDFYNVTLNVWGFNRDAIAFYRSMGMDIQKMEMEAILK